MTERLQSRHVQLQGGRFLCQRDDALIARVIAIKAAKFQAKVEVRPALVEALEYQGRKVA